MVALWVRRSNVRAEIGIDEEFDSGGVSKVERSKSSFGCMISQTRSRRRFSGKDHALRRTFRSEKSPPDKRCTVLRSHDFQIRPEVQEGLGSAR